MNQAAQKHTNLHPQAIPPKTQAPSPVKDLLTFKKMITPSIIVGIFWLGVLGSVISGFMMMGSSFGAGLVILFGGPLLVRLYCELVMLGFRNYDTLREISEQTRR